MSQTKVAKVLKGNYPRYLDYEEIMSKTGLTRQNVFNALKILKKRDDVEYKIVVGRKLRSKWDTLYRINGGC